jgi:uncharacterized protein
VILVDPSGLLSAIDRSQRSHVACAAGVATAAGPRILSPFVLAEVDYLLARRVGPTAQLALLDEVARGAYRLDPFGPADVTLARDVIARYGDLKLGLTEASIVVLARRHGIRHVLTLDERPFTTVRSLDRKRFRVLPADA